MPRANIHSTSRHASISPVMENDFNIDRFSHACRDRSRPYPTLGNVMDRSATADPNEGFTDLGFRDFIQASRRVSRRKLARIETNPYAEELLTRGVELVTEVNETYNSILEASVIHTSNIGTMLMDELAYVQARVNSRKEDIAVLEEWKGTAQDIMQGQEDVIIRQGADINMLKGEFVTLKDLIRGLVTKTRELEDDKVRLTRRISELTGEVRDLQRRCNELEVQVEEEELEVPERAESLPARLLVQYENRLVQYENRLVPIDDEVVEIREEEFYRNVGVDFDLYAEFVPDSEPNSDTEDLPNYDDLSDVDPNEIREQNWANKELGQINKPVDFCESRPGTTEGQVGGIFYGGLPVHVHVLYLGSSGVS
ncbi:hypothetical protein BJ322DRAFT_1020100 [Thelephora terrestris]|uniref:Uncharacterized protein n=1 Tax=Thelephora terrestris TaxID=56493 RepID=A0A9P6HI61_9AGAM|nr:hypothetical protein BJ322DRAFT_1020100 [Thelephora terrestris]